MKKSESHIPMTSFPKAMAVVLLIGQMAFTSPRAAAPELEHVPWQSVTVTSLPVEPLGVIVANAETDRRARYRSFSLTAFGWTRKLSAQQLAQLEGFPLYSLELRHEKGYALIGGHACIARLSRVYVREGVGAEQQSITISLSQAGDVRIDGPRTVSSGIEP